MRPASSDEKRALDPRMKRVRVRVRVLSEEGLVLCFHLRLSAHVICNFRLKTTMQFRVLYPVFFLRVFTEKNNSCYKEDVFIIFDDLQVQNSPLQISFS